MADIITHAERLGDGTIGVRLLGYSMSGTEWFKKFEELCQHAFPGIRVVEISTSWADQPSRFQARLDFKDVAANKRCVTPQELSQRLATAQATLATR